ncbi:MAG: hypothetical protein DRP42_04840 [Tenericutes bacterium]|nr:MAG: hypothetical protein DRP42_04840 [Mycoplasmatota bacterium]
MRLSRSAIFSTRDYGSGFGYSESWDGAFLKERLKQAVVQIVLETQEDFDSVTALAEHVWSQTVYRDETVAMRSMLSHLPVEEPVNTVTFTVVNLEAHELQVVVRHA